MNRTSTLIAAIVVCPWVRNSQHVQRGHDQGDEFFKTTIQMGLLIWANRLRVHHCEFIRDDGDGVLEPGGDDQPFGGEVLTSSDGDVSL